MAQSFWSLVCLAFLAPAASAQEDVWRLTAPTPWEPVAAESVIKASGVEAGLAVLVEPADAELAVDLGRSGRFLVHCLVSDAEALRGIERAAERAGLLGVVSASRFDRVGPLPFRRHGVNLLLADGLRPGSAEIERIVAPGGAAAFRTSSGWVASRQPWPDDLGRWTHFWHDATNNPVSRDRQAGPPRGLQWLSGVNSEGSNAQPGIRTDGGRLTHVVKFALADRKLREIVNVNTRDAFSGVALWNRQAVRAAYVRDVPAWKKYYPLVMADGRLFTYLDAQGKPVALDAKTGCVLETYESAQPLPHDDAGRRSDADLAVADGVLYQTAGSRLTAIDVVNGRVKWSADGGEGSLTWITVADDMPRIFAIRGEGRGHGRVPRDQTAEILGLDKETGCRLWSVAVGETVTQLLYRGGSVFYFDTAAQSGPFGNQGWGVGRIEAGSGKVLWRHRVPTGHNDGQLLHMAVVGDELWMLGQHLHIRDLDNNQRSQVSLINSACSVAFGSEKLFCLGFGRYLELPEQRLTRNWITRASCGSGMYPANGLIYGQPSRCACFAMVRGTLALTDEQPPSPVPDAARLERFETAPPTAGEAVPSDWPTFRADAARSCWVSPPGPATPRPAWSVSVVPSSGAARDPIRRDWQLSTLYNGPVTASVVADGRVFVAVRDAHRVEARRLDDGSLLWSFTAGGRIDLPPTIHEGLCLFGCRNGWVYGLRAADGAVQWRFLAAPADTRFVAYSQVESLWPVCGSVLIRGGLAIASAGYHPEADGGIHLWALRPTTGEIVWHRVLRRDPTPTDLAGQGQTNHPTADRNYFGVMVQQVRNGLLFDTGPGIGVKGLVMNETGEPLGTFRGFEMRIRVDPPAPPEHRWIDFTMRPPWVNRFYNDYSGPGHAQKYHWHVRQPGGGRVEGLQVAFGPEGVYATPIVPGWGRSTQLRWYAKGRGEGVELDKFHEPASPTALAVAGDRVYVTTASIASNYTEPAAGQLLVYDRTAGKRVHAMDLDEAPIEGCLTVVGGKVLVTLKDGRLVCFE